VEEERIKSTKVGEEKPEFPRKYFLSIMGSV